MRATVSFFLVCAILINMAAPVAALGLENAVQPRFLFINNVYSELTVSSLGVANCTGSISTQTNYPVDVWIRLQQYTDSQWTTLQSWTIEGTGSANGTKYYGIQTGYLYRLVVRGRVYDEAGHLIESGTAIKEMEY